MCLCVYITLRKDLYFLLLFLLSVGNDDDHVWSIFNPRLVVFLSLVRLRLLLLALLRRHFHYILSSASISVAMYFLFRILNTYGSDAYFLRATLLIRTRYRLKIKKIQRVEPLKSTHKMRNVRNK